MGIPICRDLGKPHSEQGQAEGSFIFENGLLVRIPSGRPLELDSNIEPR